jgi:hypothetical protein
MSRTAIQDNFTSIDRGTRTPKQQAERLHRLRRLESGFCVINGCQVRPEGRRMCEAHRIWANDTSRARRLAKKLKN